LATTTTSQESIYDKLEHELLLSDLINSDSLRNIIRQFKMFLGVGFRVTNCDGSLIYGSNEIPEYCGAEPMDCPVCGHESPVFPDTAKKLVTVECASGLKVLRVLVENQFEPRGYVLIGPFKEPAEGESYDVLAEAGQARSEPVVTAQAAKTVALLVCTVIEEVVFSNYQSYLLSKMHLQLQHENASSEEDKDAGEHGLLDSAELRSLF
jgi:hypothetical protein